LRGRLVLSLAYFIYLGRTVYPADVQWLAGALLLADEPGFGHPRSVFGARQPGR
jgi:hypothetical protein